MALRKTELNIVKLYLDNLLLGHDGAEFHTDGIDLGGFGALATLQNIEWVPTVAEREGGIGDRGQVVCRFKDFSMATGGNYFRRLLALNPYYINRKLIITTGSYAEGATDLTGFSDRLYFIKKINGPDQDGIVSVEASDVLTLLDESQCPAESNGNLFSALNDSATGVINIGDNTGFGVGHAIIDSEVVIISGLSGSDSIVITTRGAAGTEASEHDAGSPVRQIYASAGNVVDILYGLIELYSEIYAGDFIDSADWDYERDNFLASEDCEVWVTESKKTSEIIDALCKQFYINLWWDDESQLIRMKTIGPQLTSAATWTDEANILNTKFDIVRDQKNVITQVWVYYGKIKKTGGDGAENFKNLFITADGALESDFGAPSIRKIYASYIPDGSTGTASRLGSRLIAQNREPLEITLEVDDADSGVNVGDAILINSDLIQDSAGAAVSKLFRITEKRKIEFNRYRYGLVFTGIMTGARYGIIGPDELPDYLDATFSDRGYGYIADGDPPLMSNGDDPYLIL